MDRNCRSAVSSPRDRNSPSPVRRSIKIGAYALLSECKALNTAMDAVAKHLAFRPEMRLHVGETELLQALSCHQLDLAIFPAAPEAPLFDCTIIGHAPVSLVVEAPNTAGFREENLRLSGRPDYVFCLPCERRFPKLNRLVRSELERLVPEAIFVNYYTDPKELMFNVKCGAGCLSLQQQGSFDDPKIACLPVSDVTPVPLFVAWRRDDTLGEQIKSIAELSPAPSGSDGLIA